MDPIRFACPVCSVPLKSGAEDRIHCPRCGSAYPRNQIDKLCRTLVDLGPHIGESADDLKQRAISKMIEMQLPGDPMGMWNSKLTSKEVRVIGTSGEKTGPAILVLVAAPWTRELTTSVFNDLLKLAKFMEQGKVESRFQFVAPHPLPEPLHYTFGGTARGRFERMALKETGLYEPAIVVLPSRIKKLTELAQQLVKTCFRIPIDLSDPKQIKWIEELILKELRIPLPPSTPMPKTAYTPYCSLLLLAVLVGQLMLLQKGIAGEWKEDKDFPFSLSLVLQHKENFIMADPVGQTLNLFHSGAVNSLAVIYEEMTKVRKKKARS